MDKKPDIVVSSQDADRLYNLLDSLDGKSFAGKEELEAELERAKIVDPADIPPTVVTMNSTVRFAIEATQKEFELTLVYPRDVDASGTKISILTPVGSALLGLSQGDEIEWHKQDEGLITVKIQEIVYQPERAGLLYR